MQRAVLTGLRRFQLEHVDVPEPPAGHVRIGVLASGICGSDLHTYLGENPVISTPLVPGHEFAGAIEALGPGVDGLAIGDMVAARPSVPCGECRYCARGKEHLCDRMRFVGGFVYDGAFAEKVVLPASCLTRVDPLSTPAVVAFAEPVAVAVHAVGLADITAGLSVLVVGCGTIGLLVAQVARLAGARVHAADLEPSKVALAESFGAISAGSPTSRDRAFVADDGEPFAVVFDCVGLNATLAQAMVSVEKGGVVILVGAPTEPIVLDPVAVLLGERRLQGSYIYTNEEFAQALGLVVSGAVVVDPLISATFRLADIGEAFEAAVAGNERVKFVVAP